MHELRDYIVLVVDIATYIEPSITHDIEALPTYNILHHDPLDNLPTCQKTSLQWMEPHHSSKANHCPKSGKIMG